tara:strand:+ start:381 stop:602 length:222 start_codon:yes stop_codon:yes gene_type:complete
MFKVLYILLIINISYSYEVGETISSIHQNQDFPICYASDLDPNGDEIFNFSEYNGDLNGGDYFVIFLEMMTTW